MNVQITEKFENRFPLSVKKLTTDNLIFKQVRNLESLFSVLTPSKATHQADLVDTSTQ